MMNRYFIQLAFDGSNYYGWQTQPNKKTVQGVLEHALSTLLKSRIPVTGAGRTDTGVHASYFIAHFDCSSGVCDPASDRFIFKLNRFLPGDITVAKIYQVPSEKHARFSATYRSYEYHISSLKPVFNRNFCLHVYGKLNLEAINNCCEVIMETTDFTSFARLHSDVKTNTCNVSKARWKITDQGYIFEICADRFLRNMVRSITGTLLDVGMGKLDLVGFKEIVEARDRGRAGSSAPAKGLFLVDIGY